MVNLDDGQVNQQLLAKVRNWQINYTVDPIDVTTLGETDRLVRRGVRSSSGSAQLLYHTDSLFISNILPLIEKHMAERTGEFIDGNYDDLLDSGGVAKDLGDLNHFVLKFVIGRGNLKYKYLIQRCLMTSFDLTMSTGEICTAQFSFVGNGAPDRINL